MNSSKIKSWEGGKKELFFLRLGTLGIDPKEQIKGKTKGLHKVPKLQLHRFQDVRMRLQQAMAKKVTATTANDDAAFEVPPRKGGMNFHVCV
jgi:hypothetical protein